MEPIAAALNLKDMRELALYYAGLPQMLPRIPAQQNPLAVERGEAIATGGIRSQRVPHALPVTARVPLHAIRFIPISPASMLNILSCNSCFLKISTAVAALTLASCSRLPRG